MSDGLNQQLLRLAELLQLGQRAREASRDELPFVIVNESLRAVRYDQAVLWDARSEKVAALSGGNRPEGGAPYVLFLNRLYKAVAGGAHGRDAQQIVPAEVVAKASVNDENWLAPNILWWPLRVREQTVAVLMLSRREPWPEAEFPVIENLAGSYAHAWEMSRVRVAPVKTGGVHRLRRTAAIAAAIALVGLGLLPVRTSAIAPAEVVARTPMFVRAPFAGVVDAIQVSPNAPVKAGQLLVRLERRQLEAEFRVSAKTYEVASTQYRQITQEAIGDPRAREKLAELRGKLDEARADYDYRRARLERSDIVAPADGIAVFNDPAEWIGRPVEVGERIMQVSPPSSTRIEIELPVTEEANFAEGAEVSFFNNLNPDSPSDGRLVFMSYATTITPSGVLSYIARADLKDEQGLRLGLKGTAKIFGPRRPLVLWLLRRPIAFLRQLVA
ncbi:MAG: HlyD family efflux transporter periplasmic adaptor subunit [Proteobacteria bacterium]|nr:HlyD family efflux transporter periplasmic adaptor subunit [Pseudomonadota bacterium]